MCALVVIIGSRLCFAPFVLHRWERQELIHQIILDKGSTAGAKLTRDLEMYGSPESAAAAFLQVGTREGDTGQCARQCERNGTQNTVLPPSGRDGR